MGEDKRAENKLQGQRWTIVILRIITVVNIYRALVKYQARCYIASISVH